VRRLALVVLAIVVIVFALATRPQVHGLSLVVRAADLQGLARLAADRDTVGVTERMVVVPDDHVPMRARIYTPNGTPRQTVLLVTGLHPAGIDEPRLVRLSRELAKTAVIVVTPEIPELARYEITPIVTDRIARAAAWLATESGLAPGGRVGLMGISFSGGLSVVAAGRPSVRDHLLFVFSFGGHDDLRRVLEYFCTEAAVRPPHDYGVAVVLLNVAGRLVPPDQVEPLRAAVRRFLQASYVDRFDHGAAAREFAALRDLARQLPEPSATLLGHVNDRDVARLGARLRPHLDVYVDAPALSPARSPAPSAPVFLLHGRDDNVIPSSESQYLADRLRGQVPVRLLITGLVSHADADQPAGVVDVLRLAGFWGALIAQ
jgi:dienelactone hydrolase